jgi:hypothetical protein
MGVPRLKRVEYATRRPVHKSVQRRGDSRRFVCQPANTCACAWKARAVRLLTRLCFTDPSVFFVSAFFSPSLKPGRIFGKICSMDDCLRSVLECGVWFGQVEMHTLQRCCNIWCAWKLVEIRLFLKKIRRSIIH